jgi:hypothetical protein
MELRLQRLDKGSVSTLGGMYTVEGLMSWLECWTCEDEPRVNKLKGQTRIPAGRYEIKLRPEGGMNANYNQRFKFHKGMLWLQNVENFEWIYIHVGNNHKDTEGCILVGATPMHDYLNGGGSVLKSVAAYERLYLKIVDALDHEQRVHITVQDEL